MGLGQFHADRSAANDDQVVRPDMIVEDGFIGQIGDRVEARDRQGHR